MRTFIIIASLALALTQVELAEGNPNSANAIMPGCRAFLGAEPPRSNMDWFKEGECVGVLHGLADLMERLCIPSEATQSQVVRVVVNYIDRHPEKMHMPFTHLAAEALRAAWPCKS